MEKNSDQLVFTTEKRAKYFTAKSVDFESSTLYTVGKK